MTPDPERAITIKMGCMWAVRLGNDGTAAPPVAPPGRPARLYPLPKIVKSRETETRLTTMLHGCSARSDSEMISNTATVFPWMFNIIGSVGAEGLGERASTTAIGQDCG